MRAAQLDEREGDVVLSDPHRQRVAADLADDVERDAAAQVLERLAWPRHDKPARALAEQLDERRVARAEVERRADAAREAALGDRDEEAALGDVVVAV